MQAIYERLGNPSAKQLHIAALREGVAVSLKQATDFVARRTEAQIYRQTEPSKGKTATRSMEADLQIDLIDLKQFGGKFNYILFTINPFNRKIAMEPLKTKAPAEVSTAFQKILERIPKPERISSDRGREFSGAFEALLGEKGIFHRLKAVSYTHLTLPTIYSV